MPPITYTITPTCSGTTQDIVVDNLGGGDGTYYMSTTTYADAVAAAAGATTAVVGGTRTFASQPSGTRYIKITAGIQTVISGGTTCTTTTTTSTTTTTTLAPVSFSTSAGCTDAGGSTGTGAMVSFSGGSGVYQASNTTYSSEALALGGTYTDAVATRTFSSLAAGTYWVALRDKNDTNNKVAHSFTVANCPTTTTTSTTLPPVTYTLTPTCTGTTQTIVINNLAGGNGTYYMSTTTYGDAASAAAGPTSLVSGGTRTFTSQASGTRYVLITAGVGVMASGGTTCTTTTTTTTAAPTTTTTTPAPTTTTTSTTSTTTTTQPPVDFSISGVCTGTTQTITISGFSGGDGSTYYASDVTYADAGSAAAGATSVVSGSRNYTNQPSGTRYVKVVSGTRSLVKNGGQVACTTTTTTTTLPPTTTTTLPPITCESYEITNNNEFGLTALISYNDCSGVGQTTYVAAGGTVNICAEYGTVVDEYGYCTITDLGPC